jgi:hypothetical protein
MQPWQLACIDTQNDAICFLLLKQSVSTTRTAFVNRFFMSRPVDPLKDGMTIDALPQVVLCRCTWTEAYPTAHVATCGGVPMEGGMELDYKSAGLCLINKVKERS